MAQNESMSTDGLPMLSYSRAMRVSNREEPVGKLGGRGGAKSCSASSINSERTGICVAGE
jgi:hypothetical protein